jgi:membrane protein
MSVMRNPGPLRDSLKLFAQAGGLWLERNAFVHAGSLAFYTLFSMAPVVIIAVSIAGTVFGEETARGEIVSTLVNMVGPEAAQTLEDAVKRWRPKAGGLLPALTGLLVMTVGATTVFAQLQISLNRIWGVVTKPHKSGIVVLVKNRVVSLAIVITIGFILLVSLVIDVAITAVIASARDWLPIAPLLLSAAEFITSLAIVTVLFAVIFKMLPDVVIAWGDVWFSALTTGILFTSGRHLISAYLAYRVPASTYGAAGSLILILLWVYYSALILFFGAALTKARVLASGRSVVPRPLATRIREQLVDEEGRSV